MLLNIRFPIAFRLGAWYDPDHRIKFQGTPVTDDDRGAAIQFPGGEDEIHFAAGLGLVFKHFQLDLGVDYSEFLSSVALSSAFRF